MYSAYFNVSLYKQKAIDNSFVFNFRLFVSLNLLTYYLFLSFADTFLLLCLSRICVRV